MASYILRRLLIAAPVLFGITIIGFAALAMAPGDPITARISPEILARMSPAEIAYQRHQLGLDLPLPMQYLRWLGGVLHGDFGYSVTTGQPITLEVGPRLGPTLLLMGSALVVTVCIGIPAGVIAAVRQYAGVDYALAAFSLGMAAVPTFVLGLAAVYAFGVFIHLLPTSGMVTLGSSFSIQDLLAHLVLPAGILGLANAAPLVRYTRTSMLEVLTREYMITARAKGLGALAILIRHGLRNALIPVITVVGLLLPELIAGAVITEQIFAWPGMGSLAVRAASDRDPALMMGVILVVAVGVVLSNLIADIGYAIVDPRVRLGGS
jgi:peptide/nickel transport system permease protein